MVEVLVVGGDPFLGDDLVPFFPLEEEMLLGDDVDDPLQIVFYANANLDWGYVQL